MLRLPTLIRPFSFSSRGFCVRAGTLKYRSRICSSVHQGRSWVGISPSCGWVSKLRHNVQAYLLGQCPGSRITVISIRLPGDLQDQVVIPMDSPRHIWQSALECALCEPHRTFSVPRPPDP
ncbi:uncharacterized protein PV06_08343 [Exophiala oligosperma]|uniref:Uncharacterized protein n=1 Tax=Exophiala oligosperma TaxID=215243 RepID=A0A0D2D9F9_9EURO|nr:uncharacterized protein PV06_08343 [Exophiala oligosperma]KIW39758.1 hypothetical protein PV06_08343 [Exophiala oligosperma]